MMQSKSASTTLINLVYAHFILLFKNWCQSFEVKLVECKPRNQVSFFDAASEAANPTTCVGSVNRAWNNDNKKHAIKRKTYGYQYVDSSRYNAVLIGNKAEEAKEKGDDTHVNWGVNFVSDITSFYGKK